MDDIKVRFLRGLIIDHLDEQHNTELALPDDPSEPEMILEIDVIIDFWS